MKNPGLTAALGLILGTFALGAAQANEQGLRPLPEDLAAQADEMTEDTMPFPEGSLQNAPKPKPEIVQPADTKDATLSFAGGDKDGDGLLTEAELKALDDQRLVFADLDGNHDGSITRDEWNAQQPQQQLGSASFDDE